MLLRWRFRHINQHLFLSFSLCVCVCVCVCALLSVTEMLKALRMESSGTQSVRSAVLGG